MARGPAGSILGHIRKLVAAQGREQLPDPQLLQRFAAEGDEAAFAALMRRHGPMVLQVCRRVLHNWHDAEDAFRATFLLLARKAGSIRKQGSVGCWLHGVAYRMALRANAEVYRSRLPTPKSVDRHPADPADEVTWRELRAILDDELSQLPQKYRAPLLLCYLEGRTRDEAAHQLGCPLGTLKGRLERGRELFRKRLLRRGLTLPAALLAVGLSSSASSAPVPALLVHSTAQAALRFAASKTVIGRVVSSQVAALVEGGLKTMLMTKLKLATALLLAMSALTGAGLLAHQALADKPTQRATAPHPIGQPAFLVVQEQPGLEQAKDFLTVNGRVLGPDAEPVAGARLYLPHGLNERPQSQDDLAMIRRGATRQDGHFTLQLPRSDVQRSGAAAPAVLIAAADGFGLDWIELPQEGAPSDVTLRLVKEVPIRGRILTTEGKPIVGVAVNVGAVMVPAKLDDFLKALQREWRAAETMMTKQLTLPMTNVLRVTASDKEGHFEIAGSGADRLVSIELINANLARSHFLVVTHEGFDVKAMNEAIAKTGRGAAVYFGPSFDYIAEPGQVIEGTVRETDTGKPVVGATIQANGNMAVNAVVSDARGGYRIVGLRKAQRYSLRITPPVNMPLIGSEVVLSDASAPLEPVRADLQLSRGGLVKGRVLDKLTRKGAESFVQFVPLPDNKLAGKAARDQALATFTDADGHFCLATLPGSGVLLAQVAGTRETIHGVRLYPYPVNRYKEAEFDAVDRNRLQATSSLQDSQSFTGAGGGRTSLQFFNACKVVDVKEGNEGVSCDLVVDPGQTLTVNVEDTEGKPLPGAVASRVTAMSPAAVSLRNADCKVYALDLAKPRQLVLLHQERELSTVVSLRGDEPGPLTLRLGRTGSLSGRLLDQDGQPIPRANVGVLYAGQVGSDLARELRRRYELPRTDDKGRFRLAGIVPGLKFDLGFVKGRLRLKPETRLEIKPLEAGKTQDLGDIRLKPHE
jgi:RNA polymerase sigma factor (sigma-70 family)